MDDGIMKSAMGGGVVWLVEQLFTRRRLAQNERTTKEQSQQINALSEEIKDLREQRIGRIEKSIEDLTGLMKEEVKHAGQSRRGMHQEITEIRTHFVHKKECGDVHGKQAEQLDRVEALAVDLARVEERQHSTAETMKTISEQQVAIGQDLARLEGRTQQ